MVKIFKNKKGETPEIPAAFKFSPIITISLYIILIILFVFAILALKSRILK